jgi:hypothetical protein
MKILSLIMWIAFLGLTTAIFTSLHEDAHRKIYEYHGCIKPVIEYKLYGLVGGTTRCDEYRENIPTEFKQQNEMLHSMNEILGYHLYALIFASFAIYGHYIGNKKED